MRGSSWLWVAASLAACSPIVSIGADPSAAGASGQTASAGSAGSSAPAGSSQGGAAGTLIFGLSGSSPTGAGGTPPLPNYSRTCIEARLAEVDSAEDAARGGSPASSSAGGAPNSDESAGAGGENVDLELGAGDLTLLAVFDKSGSMASGWDERSKWQVANEAFEKAIEGVLDNLTLGAIFFPMPGSCEVAPLDDPSQMQFATGHTFLSEWRETAGSRVPDGSTPLERSLRVADMAIERGCGLGLLQDRFRIVLVTDGEPTCSDDNAAMIALVAEWHRIGVETWVMGLPGSSGATELLDSIAAAGGTEKHQSLGTPDELDHGLAEAAR